MKKLFLLSTLLFTVANLIGQGKTDFSLFMRSDSATYLSEKSAESGDLYRAIGHHGPAVENDWFGLRLYFDKKCVIDVYSKAKAGLELKEKKWYPTAQEQLDGWGADYYKVGSTLGLGGVRLWADGEMVWLDPVSMRTAKVYAEGDNSCMEMISEGVDYMGKKVSISTKVTVYPDSRYADVETTVIKGKKVQFVTGVNYHKGHELVKEGNFVATWGLHPEDVAAEQVELGAAIVYDPADYILQVDDGSQVLLISKKTKSIKTRITSANAREPELNTMKKFLEFLEQ